MRFFWWKPHVWQNSGSWAFGQKVVKTGSKRALFEFSRKFFIWFCSCLVRKGLLWSLLCVQSLESRKNLVLQIRGHLWLRKGSFEGFLKTSRPFWGFLCQKGALMVLQVCAKFGVQEKSGSRDFGQKVVKMGSKRALFEFSWKVFIVFSRYPACW